MITATNVIVLLAMLLGTVGIVVPVLPGLLVVWGATLVWAFERQDGPGWLVFGVATVLYAVGFVSQYLVPGRRMRSAGVQGGVVAVALAVAVVGFFVVPVVGAPLGFVLAVYLIERVKHREHVAARRATLEAVRAVALNIGIELATAFAIIATWAAAVYLTRP
ncbi:DUF456 domain-containing protein [Terrabacter sp. MAHUQ-38]|uniref:DUF456 domain-containing protein n=1 Tax=unclassified Terrabacter TaxID=2630222 RepID=UPI00165E1A30|nr:DUF456 domain-containing protein [Terrabacter sp. MAHUQ-38]